MKRNGGRVGEKERSRRKREDTALWVPGGTSSGGMVVVVEAQ
jgi:hypothetical protein